MLRCSHIYENVDVEGFEEFANIPYSLAHGEDIEGVLENLCHLKVLQLDYIHELLHPEADQEQHEYDCANS